MLEINPTLESFNYFMQSLSMKGKLYTRAE